MKINYIARLDPYDPNVTGGGEAIMRELLRWGTKPPFGPVEKLSIVTPSTIHKYDEEADLNILCDVLNLPKSSEGFSVDFLDRVIQKPYVKFDNAYVDICKEDYLPCYWDYPKECREACHPFSKRLYAGAIKCFFLSPLHREQVMKKVELLLPNTFVIRPTINTDMFKHENTGERDIDYLYVAPLVEAKGIENVLQYLEENDAEPARCVFIGACPGTVNPTEFGMQWIERAPYDQLPEIMNQAKCLIHLPSWPEPMGRIVIEAALCGCHLIVNENVGAASFDFELSDPDNYKGSIEEFWEQIKAVL